MSAQQEDDEYDTKYERLWNHHVDELTRLGWNLDAEDQDRLSELQDELRKVVEVAAENDRRNEDVDSPLDYDRVTYEEYHSE